MKTLTPALNDELTALNEQARLSRTLANISRRAETLFESGYTLRSHSDTLHLVESPKGETYLVVHDPLTGYHCSCPCFADLNTCKHLQAVDLKKAEDEAADAQWEQEEEWRNFCNGRFDR